MARRGGLGTNLDALIPTSLTVGDKEVGQQNEVAISAISPNPRQPRTHFDPVALEELIASIKEIGILQPPVVRQTTPGKYELIMGERRFRAAKAAGLKTIPVIIRQTPDNELLREALIENIHRSQLNALEEAAAYSQLLTAGAPKGQSTKKPKQTKSATPELQEIAERIGDALDTRVSIQGSAKKGTIVIEFAGAEDLKRITKAIEN